MYEQFFTIDLLVELVKPYKIPGPTKADAGSILTMSV